MVVFKYEPEYLLEQRIIDVLIADADMVTLLFSLSNAINGDDTRVYGVHGDLPEAVRTTLPRVTIETFGTRAPLEQDDPNQPLGNVTIVVNVHVPLGHRRLAQQLDGRVRYIFASTPLSTPSILAGGLVPVGRRVEARESALPSLRITSQFGAPLVGVL